MGAWGHGLFQSDQDYDIVSELTHEAGIYVLKKKVKEQEAKRGGESTKSKSKSTNADDNGEGDDDYVYESIYSPDDPDLVRNHLNSGVLVKMLDKYEARLLSEENSDPFRAPGYIFMLLGACAIGLGCPIPKTYKTTMQKVYMCVDLPTDAVKQMKKALNGPNGYKDGEPYDFGSLGLDETANLPDDSPPGPGGFHSLNVWGPGTLFYRPPKGSTKGLEELKRAKANETKYAKDVCGGCGAKTSEGGGALLDCGKCKARKYCSRDCQKRQWQFHRRVCVAEVSGKENEKK